MARTIYASIADLEHRMGVAAGSISGDTVTAAQATARLEDASAVVRAYVGPTTAAGWITTPLVEPALGDLAGVVASMVERATRNPSGVVQEQAGPFGRSFGPDASARLYLTALDKAILRGVMGVSAIRSIPITRGPIETASVVSECVPGPDGEGGYATGLLADDDPLRYKGEAP